MIATEWESIVHPDSVSAVQMNRIPLRIGETRIGRTRMNTITIDDRNISRFRHFN